VLVQLKEVIKVKFEATAAITCPVVAVIIAELHPTTIEVDAAALTICLPAVSRAGTV
jgi:hypothetical protein